MAPQGERDLDCPRDSSPTQPEIFAARHYGAVAFIVTDFVGFKKHSLDTLKTIGDIEMFE